MCASALIRSILSLLGEEQAEFISQKGKKYIGRIFNVRWIYYLSQGSDNT